MNFRRQLCRSSHNLPFAGILPTLRIEIPVLQRPLRQPSHRREYARLCQAVGAGRLQFYRKYSLKEIAHLVQGFDLGKQRQIGNTAYLFNIRRSERDCNRHCVRRIVAGLAQGFGRPMVVLIPS